VLTDDFVTTDHRAMPWDEVRGADAMIELQRTVTAQGATISFEALADDGGDVVMYRVRTAGGGGRVGDWESVVDHLTVLRDGRMASCEMFDLDQEHARLARYDELRTR
jgi:hypothetical protein